MLKSILYFPSLHPLKPCYLLGVDLTAKENLSRVEAKAVINHTNTYFMKSPFNERLNQATISEAAQNQAKILEGKVGVDGKELVDRKTPGDNRYSFVRTPSPAPGIYWLKFFYCKAVQASPFITLRKILLFMSAGLIYTCL